MITNISIITAGGRQVDYDKAEDLSIKMNRVADDLQNIEARYGEFSYSFSLPMTRNNMQIFGFAGVDNVSNIFGVNPIAVEVFNNDLLLLTGQLELQEIAGGKYKCVLYSKLTQLVDDLKDKNMQDIKSCPKIAWDYENTIQAHINANYLSCDSTPYQFPLVFYNTFYAASNTFSGATVLTDTIVDFNGTTNHVFQRDRAWQNWYYMVNHAVNKVENEVYMHQTPLAFYLKSMMEYMLADIGWSMGGSFWEDKDVKKIIMPYVGDTDVYDRASYCSNGAKIVGSSCGAGTLMLDTAKFMPDMDCMDFLKNIVLLFNLYLTIDVNNQIILFETYDVMFGNKIAPFNINSKILEVPTISKVDDSNPSISFTEIDNQRILGDNRFIISSGTSAFPETNYFITANKNLFNKVYNYIGSTDGEISIKLSAPAVKRMKIYNDYSYTDVNNSAGDTAMFLPFISKQLPEDNSGKAFNKKDTDTSVFNTEDTIQYNGKPALFFYYGISNSDFEQKTGKGAESQYFYFNFDDVNQKIPFCSPFALRAYRDNVNQTLENSGANPTGHTDDADAMLASYMQSIYLMMGSTTGVPFETDFSLILNNNNDYGETIYTRFHSNKYKRYQQSEVLTAKITCNDYDWQNLTINTPVQYKNQIYSILEINNYDVAKQQAEIKLIKQL